MYPLCKKSQSELSLPKLRKEAFLSRSISTSREVQVEARVKIRSKASSPGKKDAHRYALISTFLNSYEKFATTSVSHIFRN